MILRGSFIATFEITCIDEEDAKEIISVAEDRAGTWYSSYHFKHIDFEEYEDEPAEDPEGPDRCYDEMQLARFKDE